MIEINRQTSFSMASISFFILLSLYFFMATNMFLYEIWIEDLYNLPKSEILFSNYGKSYIICCLPMLCAGFFFILFLHAEYRVLKATPSAFSAIIRRVMFQAALFIAIVFFLMSGMNIASDILTGHICSPGVLEKYVVTMTSFALVILFLSYEVFCKHALSKKFYFLSVVFLVFILALAGIGITYKQTNFRKFQTVYRENIAYHALGQIHRHISLYFEENKKLPHSILEMIQRVAPTTKPSLITYEILGDDKYKLCSSFSYTNEEMERYTFHSSSQKILKGLNCRTFKISDAADQNKESEEIQENVQVNVITRLF